MVISATVRDIAIIVVAVQSIVIGVLIAVLIWQSAPGGADPDRDQAVDDTKATVNTARGR